jgi:Penicillin binding protein transpeptidase domain/NTF2-like N-terminal transpeptidase domain
MVRVARWNEGELMAGGPGKHQADGGSRWPAQPPTEQAPFWIPGAREPGAHRPGAHEPAAREPDAYRPGAHDRESAWDEPGWWRGQREDTGLPLPPPPRRSRRKLAIASGLGAAGVAGLAAVLILTGIVGPAKAPVPGFHPTATQPALAARQTAAAFLAAWKSGHVQKAASYTDHPAAAAAALTSYHDGLYLRALKLTTQSATAGGVVTFAVDATVGLPATTTVTATWSYASQLTAYARHGGWWVRWSPALVAPNLTAAERVVSIAIPPGAAEVADAAGNNLQDSSDPGLDNIAAALRSRAPVGQGTPGIDVALASAAGSPIASTAHVLSHPVATGVVKTTIDPTAEAAAEAAVQAHPESSMVVIQPSTGDILAIANNDGANDFALTARVAPGSTNKIITSTALFTTGLVSSPSQAVGCPQQLVINGNTFKNDQGESEPASTPFVTDFAASCNNAFARWYSSLGASALAETAEKYYGLNQQWDLGIGPGGPYYTIPPTAYNGELAQELFGQGQLEAAPLAMASVAATVDTGSFKQPIVVPGLPQLAATPLPTSVLQDLWQMMRAVTQAGGTAAGVFNGVSSPVYGKTGTASVSGQGQPNSWMVAFDPTLNVAIGCLVLGAGYGAQFAGPEVATALQQLTQ